MPFASNVSVRTRRPLEVAKLITISAVGLRAWSVVSARSQPL